MSNVWQIYSSIVSYLYSVITKGGKTMLVFKSRVAWLAALTVALMPLLSACGAETPTPTPVPPEATPTAVMAAETPTTMAAETPTQAMTGETPTTGATGATMGLDALAAEGIKPDPNAKGKFEFFSWWTAGGEAEGKNDILNLYKQL